MYNYQELLLDVLHTGREQEGRNGKTKYLFGSVLRHSMNDGFPLLTTKKISFRSVVGEVKWILSGSTDVTELNREYGVTFWDEWGPDIGPGYGHQVRHFGAKHLASGTPGLEHGTDQLETLIDGLIREPNSRRHLVSHWNPNQEAKLPPCHVLWQVGVNNETVDLMMYQRSADLFLGVPYNIAYYGLVLELIAAEMSEHSDKGYYAGDLIIVMGNVHLYDNQFDVALRQSARRPGPLPHLELDYKKGDILTGEWDASVRGYVHQGKLSAEVRV